MVSIRFVLLNSSSDFFAYLVRLPDGTPFYAGVSTGNSSSAFGRGKRYCSSILRNDYAKPIAEKVWQNGESLQVEFFPTVDKQTAFEKEAELIQLYGRKDIGTGSLFNSNDGGEKGLNPSEETRRQHGNPGVSKNAGNKRPDLAAYNKNHPRAGRPISDEEYLKRYGYPRY